MSGPEQAPRAMRERQTAVWHLNGWMRLAAQLPHGFDYLGDAAAIGRMIVAQAAAVSVEGQLADTGDKIAIRDEFAALPLRAETEIFERDQHRNREAVVYCLLYTSPSPRD